MTRTLKFWGESDDLFELSGTKGDEPDEIGCFGARNTAVLVSDGDAGLIVVAVYAPGSGKKQPGCWSIGICQTDEDKPLPEWPMTWGIGGRGYSVELTLEVPDTAIVERVSDDD